MRLKNLLFVAFTAISVVACNQTNIKNTVKQNKANASVNQVGDFLLKDDINKKAFVRGEEIAIQWSELYDSVTVFTNGRRKDLVGINSIDLSSLIEKTGRVSIRITGWKDSKQFITRKTIDVVSSVKPVKYKPKVINKYWHNPNSFTQGLFYNDGFLFEGTGQFGESKLMKNDIKTGKPIYALDIEKDQFGEGITLYDGKIYQITWISRKVHIYDVNTFERLRTIDYPYQQGWGITTINDKLILSDGTATLTIIDPVDFSQLDAFQVFDNNGPIDSLNELEYVDGVLYANVWQKSIILMIDINTGEVTGVIDCSDLSVQNNSDNVDNVLNGIAYNSKTNHFYITGKRWENMYEVVFEKNN